MKRWCFVVADLLGLTISISIVVNVVNGMAKKMSEMKTIRFTAELKLPAGYVTKEQIESMLEAYNWTLTDTVEDIVNAWLPNTRTVLSIKEAEVGE